MKPTFFTSLKDHTKESLMADLTAGLIVAVVALPLSIALAIASGVSPEQGLHTAIIAGFLVALLGGSRVQIGGPTGAFMIIVYGIVTEFGMDGLIMATMMGGLIMVLMGLLKLGSAIKYIPHPIVTGFTSGIAVTIFSSQMNDFFGLNLAQLPVGFLDKWRLYLSSVSLIDPTSLLVGLLALAIIVFWPKDKIRLPGTLVALLLATLLVQITGWEVMTIGAKFGQLSSALPRPALPAFSLEKVGLLMGPAFTIALLGSIESLLSAVVADGMIGAKHCSNTELVAQGVANMVTGLFGGLPATGAIARTVTNINNGGRSPVAGMVHALALLAIMLVFMPYAQMIPLTALAAVLMVVAYNMSEWREFVSLLKAPKSDVIVLLITFFLTVLVDLVVAIEVGMVLAALLFMKRMADVSGVQEMMHDTLENHQAFTPAFDQNFLGKIPPYVQIYEISGPMFFGAADTFLEVLTDTRRDTKVIILRMKNVSTMDATALRAVRRFMDNCRLYQIKVLLTGLQDQPRKVLCRSGILDEIGPDQVFSLFEDALISLQPGGA